MVRIYIDTETSIPAQAATSPTLSLSPLSSSPVTPTSIYTPYINTAISSKKSSLSPTSPVFTPSTPVALAQSLPPPSPLHWLWQCHVCHRTYRLAVTRRCLEDGHYFCSGLTTVSATTAARRASKRGTDQGAQQGKIMVRKHRACGSEFDYARWKVYGDWRRSATGKENVDEDEEANERKDCWTRCDYPSQCRWEKQLALLQQGKEVNAEDKVAAGVKQKGTADDVVEERWEDLYDVSSTTSASESQTAKSLAQIEAEVERAMEEAKSLSDVVSITLQYPQADVPDVKVAKPKRTWRKKSRAERVVDLS